MKRLEIGVFLPIGNNGYLISKNAPQYRPTYELNREISLVAEELGLSYVFSMSKWRGFGGATEFWDHTLESATLMTGLAAVTKRIKLVATISPPLLQPAVAAKITATMDEISQGRLGINIVTGASLAEYDQMLDLPEGYGDRRYEYATEWIQVLKRLWTEERVNHDGEFFHLRDCVSSPKPIQRPHPFLVCAGSSDEGFRFTAQQANYSFLVGDTLEETRALSQKMKETAAEADRPIRTATPMMVILGADDRTAEEQLRHFREGADHEAITNITSTYMNVGRPSAISRLRRTREAISFGGQVIAAGPRTLADRIADLAEGTQGIDSILLMFPDYVSGLRAFHAKVIPILEGKGFAVSSC